MSFCHKSQQNVAAGAIERQNCLYGRGHPIGCRNFLGPHFLAIPQAYPEACKKTQAQDKKSQS